MAKLRVLLVHVGRRSVFNRVEPPLGLLYLAGYARSKQDLDISIYDQRAEDGSYDEVVRRAVEFRADVIGLSCVTSYGHTLPGLTRNLRNSLPDALIVLGGPHASAMGAGLLEETPADALVTGEGELAFEQILRAYREHVGFEGIPGLIWRGEGGEIVTNPGAVPFVENLDDLPFPAYDLIEVSKYWRLWGESVTPPPRKYVAMFTSRGCPYHCIYCHNMFGKQFRSHSSERVVEEMSHYIKRFGVKEFDLLDDVFNFDRERVMRISDLVRRTGIRRPIHFASGLRTDLLTPDLVDALYEMGACYTILALESGSPRIQDYIGKRLNIPRFLNGVAMVAARHIFTWGALMIGFPTETEEEMKQTIEVALSSKLHGAWMLRVTPYPKTELYDGIMRTAPEKLAGIDYSDTDYVHRMAVNLSDVPDDVIAEILLQAKRRFYLSPKRMLRIVRDFPNYRGLPKYLPDLARLAARTMFT
jgi:radical SAM superfamily enzyme YgiQ (UPF0313 family)